MSKRLLTLLVLALFLVITVNSSCKKANYKFITICKVSNDTIKVDYMDSMHGIIQIQKIQMEDTLKLKIFVSILKRPYEKYLRINSKTKFLKFENKNFEIERLEPCAKVYSGPEALKHLKDFLKDK